MDKIKEQILKYLEAKYGTVTGTFSFESSYIDMIIAQRQADDIPSDLADINQLCNIVNLLEQCDKDKMIECSEHNEQAKQIMDSYYKFLKQFGIEDDSIKSEVQEEKKAMVEYHNKHFGTSYTYYCELVGQLKRIVDEKKFPDIYKENEDYTDIAYDLTRMVDDIEVIESLGKENIKGHIQNPSSPIHEHMIILMTEWVELRNKYLGMEVKDND